MKHDIPMLELSPNFTIEDIHKIREWHYECRKDMTFEEYQEDLKQGSDSFLRRLKRMSN